MQHVDRCLLRPTARAGRQLPERPDMHSVVSRLRPGRLRKPLRDICQFVLVAHRRTGVSGRIHRRLRREQYRLLRQGHERPPHTNCVRHDPGRLRFHDANGGAL
jgi:hypothetical protein